MQGYTHGKFGKLSRIILNEMNSSTLNTNIWTNIGQDFQQKMNMDGSYETKM